LPIRANTHNTHTAPVLPCPSHCRLPAPKKTPRDAPACTEDPVCNSPQQRNPPPRPLQTYLPNLLVIPIDRQIQSSSVQSHHSTLGPSPAQPSQLRTFLPTLPFSLRLPSASSERPDLTRAPAALSHYLSRHARPPHPAFLELYPNPARLQVRVWACAW
jgi:hypothetical protein